MEFDATVFGDDPSMSYVRQAAAMQSMIRTLFADEALHRLPWDAVTVVSHTVNSGGYLRLRKIDTIRHLAGQAPDRMPVDAAALVEPIGELALATGQGQEFTDLVQACTVELAASDVDVQNFWDAEAAEYLVTDATFDAVAARLAPR